ncbi:MAG: GDP-mannose dehydrogenase [Candidatus Bathyarchaeales archaeon]
MAKEKVLVIGLGEIGLPLFELLRESEHFTIYGLDIDEKKMRKIKQKVLPSKVDVIHICIPCVSQDEFINAVIGYVKRFEPNLVILNSTIPPGTTMKIHERSGCLVAHSPVRGVHRSLEYMKWELKRWTKYVGGVNAEAARAARKHFEKIGLKTKVLKSCMETELAKLFETTYRAWMIACFQEMHRISRRFEADFDGIMDFLEDTHRVRLDRPLMFPDVIGGHCLIQNAELLLKSYNSEFLKLILKSNEKRKEEVQDVRVRSEVEKVKKRVEKLERELAKNPKAGL